MFDQVSGCDDLRYSKNSSPSRTIFGFEAKGGCTRAGDPPLPGHLPGHGTSVSPPIEESGVPRYTTEAPFTSKRQTTAPSGRTS